MSIVHFRNPICVWDHIDVAMVRDPKHYTYLRGVVPDREAPSKIQLGSGFKNLEGWRNLEYPEWDADKPIPAAGYSALKDVDVFWEYESPSQEISLDDPAIQGNETISEIASYHTLDHLGPDQVIRTLREIERVLIPGGTFTNIVPHGDSQLAKECIHHRSRFMIDTWRNIFSERQYAHDGEWKLEVGMNFTFAIAERNTVLITQLVKMGEGDG